MRRIAVGLLRSGAGLTLGSTVLPWVTMSDGFGQQASGLDVAAGALLLWHQPEIYLILPCSLVVLLLAGACTRPAVRWLLAPVLLLATWICGTFLIRPVPFGDSTPQPLLWGFDMYHPGYGSLVCLVGCVCMGVGLAQAALADPQPLSSDAEG